MATEEYFSATYVEAFKISAGGQRPRIAPFAKERNLKWSVSGRNRPGLPIHSQCAGVGRTLISNTWDIAGREAAVYDPSVTVKFVAS
jgi:hypothetical protein